MSCKKPYFHYEIPYDFLISENEAEDLFYRNTTAKSSELSLWK
jgi:hypothetical protein